METEEHINVIGKCFCNSDSNHFTGVMCGFNKQTWSRVWFSNINLLRQQNIRELLQQFYDLFNLIRNYIHKDLNYSFLIQRLKIGKKCVRKYEGVSNINGISFVKMFIFT